LEHNFEIKRISLNIKILISVINNLHYELLIPSYPFIIFAYWRMYSRTFNTELYTIAKRTMFVTMAIFWTCIT
jgi:hypothetical protein